MFIVFNSYIFEGFIFLGVGFLNKVYYKVMITFNKIKNRDIIGIKIKIIFLFVLFY